MKTQLILLAAGQSQRFGGIKQLTDIYGQPMICHYLSHYRKGEKWLKGITNGCEVLGANAALISQILLDEVNQYVVSSWLKGMGHTLAQSILNIADTSRFVQVKEDSVFTEVV